MASKIHAGVVTCIESGGLEDQVLTMVGSLRRWGGKLADLPVYAVKARLGPPLRRDICQQLRQMNVTLLHASAKDQTPYYFFGLVNKPVALLAVTEHVSADVLIWLDGDTLIVKEPTQLLLDDKTDFAAISMEKSIGSCGPADPFEPFWQAMADSTGVPLDSIGWVTTDRDHRLIRFYVNSGVMAFRPASAFAKAFLDAVNKVMSDRFVIPQTGYYLHEQSAIGFALAKHQLRWLQLDQSYNFRCGMRGLDAVKPEALQQARILHYHGAMTPRHFENFLKFLTTNHEAVSVWLSQFGPVGQRVPLFNKALGRLYRQHYKSLAARYRATCSELPIHAREGEG